MVPQMPSRNQRRPRPAYQGNLTMPMENFLIGIQILKGNSNNSVSLPT